MRMFPKNRFYETENPYDSPTLCGLKILEVTEEPNLCYEFNMVVLWEDLETGKRYWARDSGCSCPTPFEDLRGLGDLDSDMSTYEAAKYACAHGK